MARPEFFVGTEAGLLIDCVSPIARAHVTVYRRGRGRAEHSTVTSDMSSNMQRAAAELAG